MKTFEELVKTAATCHVVATDCLESFSGLGVRVVCELFIKPLWFRERTVACAQSAKSKSGNVGARLAGDNTHTSLYQGKSNQTDFDH